MKKDKYLFSSPDVITSYEFSMIETYLLGRNITPSEALGYMKRLPGLTYSGDSYKLPIKEAWNYFQKNYSQQLDKKRIRTYDRLAYDTQEYFDKFSD